MSKIQDAPLTAIAWDALPFVVPPGNGWIGRNFWMPRPTGAE